MLMVCAFLFVHQRS